MFRKIAEPFKGLITIYATMGIICAVITAASVYYFQRLVDALTTGQGIAALLPLVAAYGATCFVVYALNYLEEYPYNQLYQGIFQYIKQLALRKVSTIDYTAYQDIGTGRLVQLVENGAIAGRDILFDFYLHIAVRLVPEAVASIALMGVYNVGIMLAALSGYILVFIITRLLLGRLYAIKERTLISEEWLSKTYVRAFMELVVFRVNRRLKQELAQVEKIAGQVVGAHTRIRMVHEAFFTLFAIIVLAIKLVLIGTSAGAVFRGEMSVGILLALLTLTDHIYQPIAIFNVIYVDFKLNRVTWDRFMTFMDTADDPNLTGGETFVLQDGHIQLVDVSFGYGEADVLTGVTLDIPAGHTVALVGKSGGGKSTLVKLVMGLIKPTRGQVLVDGQSLSAIALDGYYQHIAYVSQDAPVFDGTLRENIGFDGAADDAGLWQALAKAQLAQYVAALPQGLDTPVGEHGVKLSGGEKQRLAFARVFYQRPAVVILDEPTSALDQETERLLMETARFELSGCTVLSIAHRLSTVRYAQRIVVLEGGHIVEEGTHGALLAADGAYAALLRTGDAASHKMP